MPKYYKIRLTDDDIECIDYLRDNTSHFDGTVIIRQALAEYALRVWRKKQADRDAQVAV